MCFRHDYDWYAEVYETTEGRAVNGASCDECGCRIHPREWRHHVWMQESESCVRADHDHDDDAADNDGDCDYGEEQEYTRCEACHLLIAAIREVEEEEGCTGDDAVPPLARLDDAMDTSDHVDEYHERAMVLYPSLAMSGHLGRFARVPHEYEDLWTTRDLEPVDELGGEA